MRARRGASNGTGAAEGAPEGEAAAPEGVSWGGCPWVEAGAMPFWVMVSLPAIAEWAVDIRVTVQLLVTTESLYRLYLLGQKEGFAITMKSIDVKTY